MAGSGPSFVHPRPVVRRGGLIPGWRLHLLKVRGWLRPELRVSAWRASLGVQVPQAPHEVQDRTLPGSPCPAQALGV
jgi:hypothetical protein